jgi:hypothetical protein
MTTRTAASADLHPRRAVARRRPAVACLVAGAVALGATMLPLAGRAGATTAAVALRAGPLGIVGTSPAQLAFDHDGRFGDAPARAVLAVTVSDATGSGAGWRLLAASSRPTEGSTSVPAAALSVAAAPSAVCAAASSCTPARDDLEFPLVRSPTGAADAAPIADAMSGSGLGTETLQIPLALSLPEQAPAGVYRATLYLSLTAGP